MISRLHRRRRLLGLGSVVTWLPAEAWQRCVRTLARPLWALARSRNDDVLDLLPGRDPVRLRAMLEEATGLTATPLLVDLDAYRDYVASAGYPRRCYGVETDPGAPFHEKTLEHFVAFQLLDLQPGATYLDVASNLSPVPDVAERLYGCRGLRQDLCYPPGRHGSMVGSPASRIPLEDGSVDAITLHCAFEHFEGDEDTAFIREAERILKPGGRLCILPLYLAERHTLVKNRLVGGPALDDPGVELRLRVRRRESPFSRFYRPEVLRERVLEASGLHASFHYVENPEDVAPGCYLKFVLVMVKGGAGMADGAGARRT